MTLACRMAVVVAMDEEAVDEEAMEEGGLVLAKREEANILHSAPSSSFSRDAVDDAIIIRFLLLVDDAVLVDDVLEDAVGALPLPPKKYRIAQSLKKE